MSSVSDIRSQFLNFFASRDHEIVASSPLVPQNDPTLMFANSGMVQFKNVFTGLENRPYSRASTSQKCVRAGGKHNDLENVGYTARHHTFFEMLGNFSFGDYFKEVAIEQAWQLITSDFGLARDKLLVTVYSEDEKAAGLWRKIAGLNDDRIIRISTSDNFWSMGNTGPCGPCSEIFYDHGDHIPGGPPGSPDEDGDRFIEIWNLVFMQYEQTETERLNLPRPSIDTGMGLERIAAVLQGKHDNYDIDLMRALIEASADVSNTEADGAHNVSHRVVADHLRSAGFLIADGVLPSNEGRGYVLRRIMRRAMRHLHQIGCAEPVMYRLVPALVREMGGHYPELVRADALITETLKLEETRFKDALARGLKILHAEIDGKASAGTLDGRTAFKLYDTYGFPLDLTEDFMRGYGWSVDVKGFEAAMDAQKQAARQAWTGSGSKADNKLYLELADQHGPTEFLGYTRLSAEAVVTTLIREDKICESASAGDHVQLTTNQTPFYGESGGQVGDTGLVLWTDGQGRITNTTKTAGLFIHHVEIEKGQLVPQQSVTLQVDAARRESLRAHHSATHLLHEALREVLGAHVAQKGSLVSPERLRFDFSHPQAMNENELQQVEAIVNSRIRANSEVATRIMTPDEATAEGALALFGEKYGDEVRVVSMGGAAAKGQEKAAWSVELCGGTHVQQTGDIALLKIVSESAVAGGVRRIEATAHESGLNWLAGRNNMLADIADQLKTSSEQVSERVSQLLEDRKRMEKEITSLRQKLATGGGAESQAETIGNISFIGKVLGDTPPRDLKPMADNFRQGASSSVICLVSDFEGKASIVVSVSDDLTGNYDAVALVKAAAQAVGGSGGGGRADMAQAGGPDGDKAEAAISAVRGALKS